LMPDAPPLTKALRRLAPYLGMEIAVVLAVFAFPVLVHPEKLFEPRPAISAPTKAPARRLEDLPMPAMPDPDRAPDLGLSPPPR
ncbi:MAG: hypothetical protein GX458_14810, partial [Phyllobacteriaceae bacterium]|nr:hypothetical protein [Phyllobacteriaceae bacterium]